MSFDFKLPPPGQRLRLENLIGAADAMALADLARAGRPLVVLTETALDAQRLKDELPFFAPELGVHLMPDWETLPYDHFSPHQDLVSERLATLYQIGRGRFDVVIMPTVTALTRLAPKAYLAAHTFFLKAGQKLEAEALREQLTMAGYEHVGQVLRPGEFSVRGGLIDLFPMGSPLPYRIDLFDEEIETIKTFDVDTQRSVYPVREVRLLPAREVAMDEAGVSRFRQNFRGRFEGDPSRSQLYKDVSNRIAPPGIEYFLPLFFDETSTLFDYLPAEAVICLHGAAIQPAMARFYEDTEARYRLLRGDRDRPLLPPAEIFLTSDEFQAALKPYPRIEMIPGPGSDTEELPRHTRRVPVSPVPDVSVDRRQDSPLARLQGFLDTWKGRTLLVAESMGRRETILQMLRDHGLQPDVCDTWEDFQESSATFAMAAAPVTRGAVLLRERIALITEAELYATQVRQSRRRDNGRKSSTEGLLRDLSEVRVGDPVVHVQHGIGRYQGLVSIDLGEGETEFLTLEYAGGDKLYVPVSQLHLISRYSGASPETAPLHKLGSGAWERAKKRAAEQVRDTAAELLHLYARRAAREGHPFIIREHEYEAFAAGFEFEETPDQAAAINAVLEDMRSGKPMDRLVCGDVGFGKTEVALRAAFCALMDGQQVAVLVPTTLLAEQHFQNFSDRLADWPVKIAELSRFKTTREINAVLKGLADGQIDLVIGTHKLIQKDIRFKNLGLVIIDEEHRFGVRQKEQLKALRAEVDVLTLTATPIPRTLSMALEGLRDFSVIATAPQKRLSIKTFVHPYNDGVIREAVLRELKRGGQVYFLHNEVETMPNMLDHLQRILPEARIGMAHGQMRERELEHVMRDFYQQRFNILLCSTIIETGIDVPTANTIIMNRADRFGLAQLHQLRGRVGRSHHQAYAYLLTPETEALSVNGRKRLEAIQLLEDLGAGFHLSMHDLEIRGAGELLGESQSGEMHEIGFTLYAEMLAHAVDSLRKGKEPDMAAPMNATTEINLRVPALLPKEYCGDIHERLVIYKRLANCESLEDLDAIQEELIDRFGLLPPPARALLDTHYLRVQAKPLGVAKVDAGSGAIVVQFAPDTPIEPIRIIKLIQQNRRIRMNGQDRLRIECDTEDVTERVNEVRSLFRNLA